MVPAFSTGMSLIRLPSLPFELTNTGEKVLVMVYGSEYLRENFAAKLLAADENWYSFSIFHSSQFQQVG